MKDHSVYVEEPDVVELKACPFCGSANIEAEPWTNGNYRIGCSENGEEGPACPSMPSVCEPSETEAIAAWNTRASTPPVTVDDVDLVAFDAAITTLRWRDIPALLKAAESLREQGFNNAGGHMSAHMAGRLIDAYSAARAALEAIRNRPEGGRPLRGNHATREPSPSGLGPTGECQAQGEGE